jgi:DNA repair protein RadA
VHDLIGKISTGSNCIDKKLLGGITPETITMIYGEPETGKTTLALQCAANCALQGEKTLFVDCDNTFAPERLSQITREKFTQIAEQIILIKPNDFAEQTVLVDNLLDYISKNFGLVIFDTFNSLYRVKISDTTAKASFGVNRELNRQIAILAQATKTNHIPIILTSQVKAVFDQPSVSVAPVATRVLQFWADIVIALKPTENPRLIKAVLEKNRNTQEATCYLRIGQTGIHDNE